MYVFFFKKKDYYWLKKKEDSITSLAAVSTNCPNVPKHINLGNLKNIRN